MAQQLLNGSDIVTALQQMCRKTMAKSVAAGIFVNTCPPDSVFYGRLNPPLMDVMAAYVAGSWIFTQLSTGKNILPCQFSSSVGVFSGQCMWKMNKAGTFFKCFLVKQSG